MLPRGLQVGKDAVPVTDVIRPMMQLRAGIERISTVVLKKHMGFGVSQFRILYVLAFKPHITQKDIAIFWDVTEASVSRQVGILERRGFVTRKPQTAISLTGKHALERAMELTAACFEEIFRDITPAERKTIASLLEKLLEKVKISQAAGC